MNLILRQGAVFTPQQLEAGAIGRSGRGFVLMGSEIRTDSQLLTFQAKG